MEERIMGSAPLYVSCSAGKGWAGRASQGKMPVSPDILYIDVPYAGRLRYGRKYNG